MNPHISIPAMEAPFTRKTSQRYARFHESRRYPAAAVGKSRPAAIPISRNLTRAGGLPRLRRTDRPESPEFQIRRRQMAAKNEMDRTRRHVVGGLSAGLVAAFGGPAVAQNDVSGTIVMKPQESPMSEGAPVKDYPHP